MRSTANMPRREEVPIVDAMPSEPRSLLAPRLDTPSQLSEPAEGGGGGEGGGRVGCWMSGWMGQCTHACLCATLLYTIRQLRVLK